MFSGGNDGCRYVNDELTNEVEDPREHGEDDVPEDPPDDIVEELANPEDVPVDEPVIPGQGRDDDIPEEGSKLFGEDSGESGAECAEGAGDLVP